MSDTSWGKPATSAEASMEADIEEGIEENLEAINVQTETSLVNSFKFQQQEAKRYIKLQCLQLAARQYPNDNAKVLEAARSFYNFVRR